MDKRVPQPVQGMIKDYLTTLEACLPGQVEGVYLHGSIALNAFDSASDVDFVSIINHELSCKELAELNDLHGELAEKYPFQVMEGSYIDWDDLKDTKPAPYFDGFTIRKSAREHQNPVTWWLLKRQGICLKGPKPETLCPKVSDNDLIQYVYNNMNDYWKKRAKKFWYVANQKQDLPQLEIDAEIEWSILGLLRQVYTLKEHNVTSKLGAAQYGLRLMPKEFHPIIKEAIRLRKGVEDTDYNSDQERLEDTFQLLGYLFEVAEGLVREAPMKR